MRRKETQKIINIFQKNIFDKNYKICDDRLLKSVLKLSTLKKVSKRRKLKSSKKRYILKNYFFLRYLYNFIKTKIVLLNYRNNLQNANYNLYFPGIAFQKRMFLKNIDLFNFLKKINKNYFWLNGILNNTFKKNKNFFKIHNIPIKYGSYVIMPENHPILLEDQKLHLFFFKSHKFKEFSKENILINPYIFFNLCFLNIAEIYKILIYLNFFRNTNN